MKECLRNVTLPVAQYVKEKVGEDIFWFGIDDRDKDKIWTDRSEIANIDFLLIVGYFGFQFSLIKLLFPVLVLLMMIVLKKFSSHQNQVAFVD